jgi:hypothetical protein
MKEVDARGLSCPEPIMLTAAGEGIGKRASSEDECRKACEGSRQKSYDKRD